MRFEFINYSNLAAKDLATIADVMKVFKDNTCIRFVPRSDEVPYLNIVNEGWYVSFTPRKCLKNYKSSLF